MTSLNVNIEKLKRYGQDIVELSKEYNTLIEDLFETLKSIPEKTYIGDINNNGSAYRFIEKINQEKNIYTNYGASINKCGNILIEYTEDINQIIKENKYEINPQKITFESNIIKNNVEPSAHEGLKFVKSAHNHNLNVKIDIDVGQNYINQEINDIINQINKYINWTREIDRKYNNVVETTREKINSISIERVKRRETIVTLN